MTQEEIDEQERNSCREKPSKRSSAECELPEHTSAEAIRLGNYRPYHAGRTKHGYWKVWAVNK